MEAQPFPLRSERSPAIRNEPSPQVFVSPARSTCDTKDHLTHLPYDIRLTILEFLLKPRPLPPRPKVIKEGWEEMGEVEDTSYEIPRPRPPHPLNQLAATSKLWRDQVEAFCGHRLLVLKQQIAL
jgi:hypothetical protein